MMSPTGHFTKAESLLDGAVAETVTEGALMAIGHVLLGWALHATGKGYQ